MAVDVELDAAAPDPAALRFAALEIEAAGRAMSA